MTTDESRRRDDAFWDMVTEVENFNRNPSDAAQDVAARHNLQQDDVRNHFDTNYWRTH